MLGKVSMIIWQYDRYRQWRISQHIAESTYISSHSQNEERRL